MNDFINDRTDDVMDWAGDVALGFGTLLLMPVYALAMPFLFVYGLARGVYRFFYDRVERLN